MIKINLLGVPKPKRGKRGGGGGTTTMPAMAGEGPNPVVIGVIIAAIVAKSPVMPAESNPKSSTTNMYLANWLPTFFSACFS